MFSSINLFGLATSMAACLMITLYVFQEVSFDRFHEHARQTYRLALNIDIQGDVREEAVTSHATGPDLLQAFPEVLHMTRVSGWSVPVNVWKDMDYVTVHHGLYAEPGFFDVFSFRLLRGDPETALAEPYAVVLTEHLAESLFPNEDPMGKVIRIDDQHTPYIITGIIENSPPNTHLQYNLLRSAATLYETSTANFYEWDANISAYTYVVLAEGTDMELLARKTETLTYEKLNYKFEGVGVHIGLVYFPLADIRLHSPYAHDMIETGTVSKVWVFSVVALFVLFIAGFNYVNLTIARSGRRAREVGMRKVLGAGKVQLRTQFYLESILITAISFLLALVLAEAGLHLFNSIMDANIKLMGHPWWFYTATVLVFVGFFGFLAGIYPTWYMMLFQPVKILKGEFWTKPGRFQPRNLLLLIQFIVSLALITCTLVIFLQSRFLSNTSPGYNEKQLLVVRAETLDDAALLSNALAGYGWFERHALATSFPGGGLYVEGVEVEDVTPGLMAQRIWVDHNFLETMDIRLLEGRFFEADGGLETEYALVNQTFARKVNWADPVGKVVTRGGRSYRIIGLVEDFHMQSLHNEIEPMLIGHLHSRPDYMPGAAWVHIRYTGAGSAEVLSDISSRWAVMFPDKTFTYYFLQELIRGQYANEYSFGRLFLSLTALTILIAMLGVLGLTSFTAQQRQKEISIRKVLGASPVSLFMLMSFEMLKWVLLAAVVALPLAWYVMERWLAGFAYAIHFPYWTMAASLGAMVLMAIAIVTTQSGYTIRKNPSRVLSFE